MACALAARENVRIMRARGETPAKELLALSASVPNSAKGGEVGIDRLLARFRHVLNWAIVEGYTETTPFKRGGVSVVRLARVDEVRTRRLQPGEEAALLTHASPHLHALIVAALSTGCRRGELLSLQWKHVRLDSEGQAREFVLEATNTKTKQVASSPSGFGCALS
jgi:integrase